VGEGTFTGLLVPGLIANAKNQHFTVKPSSEGVPEPVEGRGFSPQGISMKVLGS
jgi:hypothetical protein